MNNETASVAAAISRVWSVNSDHQCAITSRRVFSKASKVGLPLSTEEISRCFYQVEVARYTASPNYIYIRSEEKLTFCWESKRVARCHDPNSSIALHRIARRVIALARSAPP